MERIALVRTVISALVGGFLIIYAAVAHPTWTVVLVVLGLVLLGVIAIDVIPIGRRPGKVGDDQRRR